MEEIEEFKKDESAEEFDRNELVKIKEKKAEEKGKFKDRIILDES